MEHKRIITELSACEEKLDTVLFDAGVATGAGIGTAGVLGAGYLYGRKKSKDAAKFTLKDVVQTTGRGLTEGASDLGKSAKSIWEALLKRMPK
jgi:hypothetical protein